MNEVINVSLRKGGGSVWEGRARGTRWLCMKEGMLMTTRSLRLSPQPSLGEVNACRVEVSPLTIPRRVCSLSVSPFTSEAAAGRSSDQCRARQDDGGPFVDLPSLDLRHLGYLISDA